MYDIIATELGTLARANIRGKHWNTVLSTVYGNVYQSALREGLGERVADYLGEKACVMVSECYGAGRTNVERVSYAASLGSVW